MGSLTIEMLSERLVDDLGNGQAVEVRLAPDGFDPAALDMEGDALGLLGGIAGPGAPRRGCQPPCRHHPALGGVPLPWLTHG